jgi:hypothetical protein
MFQGNIFTYKAVSGRRMGGKNRITIFMVFILYQVLLGRSNEDGGPGEARGTHNEGNKWKQHLMGKSEGNR